MQRLSFSSESVLIAKAIVSTDTGCISVDVTNVSPDLSCWFVFAYSKQLYVQYGVYIYIYKHW